jgi:predicted Zn-dependent protease
VNLIIALLIFSSSDTLITKIRESLKKKDIEEANHLAEIYLKENKDEGSYLLVSRLFSGAGYREEALYLLKEGRRVLRDETLFAHEFYIDAISKREFKRAVREALNLLLKGRDMRWVEREIIRIKSFLGLEVTVEEIKRWRKKYKLEEVDDIIASLYINEGKLEEAVKVLGKKGEPSSLERLAEQALREGKFRIALDALNRVGDEHRDPVWFYLYAKAKENLGELEEAAKNYEIAWRGGVGEARIPLFELLLDPLNNPKKVLSLTEDNPDEWYMRALLRLGRFEEADSLCSHIVENEEVSFMCAELKLLEGDLGLADSLLREILMKYGRGKRANDALIWLYLINNYGGESDFLLFLDMEKLYLQGKYGELEGRIREILKGKSRLKPYYLNLYASALLRKGNYNEALSLLLEAGKSGESYIGAKSLLMAARIAEDNLKNRELSKDILRDLLLNYPDSPYAEVARTQLESP